MILVPTEESQDTKKSIKKIRNNVRDHIRPITNNPKNYDKKYLKTKFNPNYDLPLKLMPKHQSVFHDDNKYHFLDEC